MRFLRCHKIAFLVTSAIVVILFFVLPPIVGALLRGHAEKMIQEAAKDTERMNWLPRTIPQENWS